MYNFIFALFLTIMYTPLFAQHEGYVKIIDVAELKASMKLYSEKTNSLRSNFKQVKEMSLLDEQVTSGGIFVFKKNRKVRMEYTSPFKYVMVINGEKIQIKDRQKTNTFASGSNKLFASINNIMVDCMTGNVLENSEFTSTSYLGKENYLIELVPKKKELKDFFESINVFISKADYSVNEIIMFESMGDKTIITFTEKKVNIPVDEKEFTIN